MISSPVGHVDVTVIVVAYNHARFVVDCLDSIRAQTAQPIQVLIADDASPDTTAATIRAYLADNPGFAQFYASPVNRGLNRTLNDMLSRATGRYVTYIAADDYMLPSRLERHAALLDASPDSTILAYSDAIVVDEDGQVRSEPSSSEFPWPDEPARSRRTLEELVERNWIPAASFFMRTDMLKAAGGYREKIFFEDYELLLRLARTCSFVYTTEPLVAVRRVSTSLGATGFRGDSPRFIRAQFTALSNAVGVTRDLDQTVLPRLWELARRADRARMPRSDVMRMTWAARRGAPGLLPAIKGLGRSMFPRRN